MFRKQFYRTFVAMFWGWLVCNVSTLIGLLVLVMFRPVFHITTFTSVLSVMIYWLIFSAIFIVVAWLAILFPTDCIVSEHSCLRQPRMAGVIGFTVGFLTVFAPLAADMWARGRPGMKITTDLAPFGLLAAITGLTAALHVVLKHPRIPSPPTTD